jgi:hypothetical protein
VFRTAGAILDARPSQVVFLSGGTADQPPAIIEWEISGSALMRRRGPCPESRPAAFPHSIYVDNKTMLEGLKPGGVFTYTVAGQTVEGVVSPEDLSLVDKVELKLVHAPPWDSAGLFSDLAVVAPVGRQ